MTTGYIQECTASLDVKAAMELLKADAATVGADQEANVRIGLGQPAYGGDRGACRSRHDRHSAQHARDSTQHVGDEAQRGCGCHRHHYSAANATNAATNYAATDTPAAIATE